MGQYRNIFLIVDDSRQRTPAWHRAVQLARVSGANLTLGAFVHHPAIAAVGLLNSEVSGLAQKALLQGWQSWLERVAGELREQGIKVEINLRWSAPPLNESIVTAILSTKPDLVVKDVHLEPSLKRILFAPLDWQLLRLCPSPLMLVNAHAQILPVRIVAAVDPVHSWHRAGALNDLIVRNALDLALQCNARVEVVSAFEGLQAATLIEPMMASTAFHETYEMLRQQHQQRFGEFTASHSIPPERTHIIFGPPDLALTDAAADSAADVLVLGTLYRTGVDRLLVGSTAERVLNRVRCDVLAVKPAGFMADLEKHLGLRTDSSSTWTRARARSKKRKAR